MIKINKLYSEPQIFNPITFINGINIIVGEKIEDNNKTIGVGKSLCIEFINFCLLKQGNSSRVLKIPTDDLPNELEIKLDIEIHKEPLTIVRSIAAPSNPVIIRDNIENKFDNLDDATKYLGELLFNVDGYNYPSFREMIALLIRDERSEFKDILQCFDTDLNIPVKYEPHLYFFNIHLNVYKKLKRSIEEINSQTKYLTKINNQLTNNKQKKFSDVKAELNEIINELSKINNALENLQTSEAFESIQSDIVQIENELEDLRNKQKFLRYEINKIESLPKYESIDEREIKLVYNSFSTELGTYLLKSWEQVKEFKEKVEGFQRSLLHERLNELKNSLDGISKNIKNLDHNRARKISLIDTHGKLDELKTSFAIYNKKNEETARIRSLFKEHEDAQRSKKELILLKDELILQIDTNIKESEDLIKSFSDTILEIHDFIMGNKRASFSINVLNDKLRTEMVNIELRIFDDGSHSVDRAKVFIYDIALLYDEKIRVRHPKLLVHDNIFEVDQDTLIRSLNFLSEMENKYDDFQYIFTLNYDKIEYPEVKDQLKLDIDVHKIASFTKNSKFLQMDYQEI